MKRTTIFGMVIVCATFAGTLLLFSDRVHAQNNGNNGNGNNGKPIIPTPYNPYPLRTGALAFALERPPR
jgi:hypothetical protein